MKYKIFYGRNKGAFKNEINDFLNCHDIKIFFVTQSESEGECTISIFYEENQKETKKAKIDSLLLQFRAVCQRDDVRKMNEVQEDILNNILDLLEYI